jgi:N-acetylglutamate synthase-like GNAT family acetyltransferase
LLKENRDLRIRLFEQGDSERACEFIRAIGTETLGHRLHQWEDGFTAPEGTIWVAESDGRAVGFGGEGEPIGDTIILHSDIVDPKCQKHGIGTALVLVRLASGDLSASHMGVVATEHSRSFYRRFGFETCADPIYHPMEKLSTVAMTMNFDQNVSDLAFAQLNRAGVDTPFDDQIPTFNS